MKFDWIHGFAFFSSFDVARLLCTFMKVCGVVRDCIRLRGIVRIVGLWKKIGIQGNFQ